MKQLTMWCGVAIVLAGCPKKQAGPVEPEPGPPAGKVAAPKVNDATVVCRAGEQGRTVFLIELGFPAGCGPIPTEPGGQATDLEITIEDSPPKAYIMEPIDLVPRSVAFVSEGCGAAIVYVGAIGTLELEVAPIEYGGYDIKGTGRWSPAGGTACNIDLTGTYRDYEDSND